MKTNSFLKRLTSLFLAITLTFSSLLPSTFAQGGTSEFSLTISQAPSATTLLDEIQVPSELGFVRKKFQSKSNQLIIHIQDAHAVPEAQKSIEKLLTQFRKDYGINTVFIEGTEGVSDAILFSAYPDKKELRKIFNAYLESGELAGAAVASVFYPEMKFTGVEDWKTYEEGILEFNRALNSQNVFEKDLNHQQKELDQKKEKIYSPKMLALERAWKSWEANAALLGPLLEYLEKLDSKRFKQNPHLASLLRVIHDEEKGRNTPKQILQKIQKMQGEEFFSELKTCYHYHKNKLLNSRDQKQMNAQDRRLELLKKLVRFELTFEEWSELKRIADSVERIGEPSELNAKRSTLNAYFSFYENAEKRNQIMLDKTLKSMRDQNVSVSILITGGFHTEYLNQELKKKKISYLEITPAISSLPKENHYSDYMQGKVSWQNYFEVKNGRIDLYDAFARAMLDQLMGVRDLGLWVGKNQSQTSNTQSFILKEWRDNILRTLAQQGQIKKASTYTKYLDDLAWKTRDQKFLQDLKKKWEGKIDQFISGLQKLETNHELNERNFAQLLRQGTTQAFTANFHRPGLTIADPVHARSEVRGRPDKYGNRRLAETGSKPAGNATAAASGRDLVAEALSKIGRSGGDSQGNASTAKLYIPGQPGSAPEPAPDLSAVIQEGFAQHRAALPPAKSSNVLTHDDLPRRIANATYDPAKGVERGNFGNGNQDESHRFYMRHVGSTILAAADQLLELHTSTQTIPIGAAQEFIQLLFVNNNANRHYREIVLSKLNEAGKKITEGNLRAILKVKKLEPYMIEHLLAIILWYRDHLSEVSKKDLTLGTTHELWSQENPREVRDAMVESYRRLAFGWNYIYIYASHVGIAVFNNAHHYSLLPHWIYLHHYGWRNRFENPLDAAYMLAKHRIHFVYPQEDRPYAPAAVRVVLEVPYQNLQNESQQEISLFILKRPLTEARRADDYNEFKNNLDTEEMLALGNLTHTERAARLFRLAQEGRILFNLDYTLEPNQLEGFLQQITVNDYERQFLRHHAPILLQSLVEERMSELSVTEGEKQRLIQESERSGIYSEPINPKLMEDYPFGLDEEERKRIQEARVFYSILIEAQNLMEAARKAGKQGDESVSKIEEVFFRNFINELHVCSPAQELVLETYRKEAGVIGERMVDQAKETMREIRFHQGNYSLAQRKQIISFAARLGEEITTRFFERSEPIPFEAFSGKNLPLLMDSAVNNRRVDSLGWRRFAGHMKVPGWMANPEGTYVASVAPAFVMMNLGFKPRFLGHSAGELLAQYHLFSIQLILPDNDSFRMLPPLMVVLGKQESPVDIYILKRPFEDSDRIPNWNNLDGEWKDFLDHFETDASVLEELTWTTDTPSDEHRRKVEKLMELAAEGRVFIQGDFALTPESLPRYVSALTRWPRRASGSVGEAEKFEVRLLESVGEGLSSLQDTPIEPAFKKEEFIARSVRQARLFFAVLDLVDIRNLNLSNLPALTQRLESWMGYSALPIFGVLPVLMATGFVLKADGTCCQVTLESFGKIHDVLASEFEKARKLTANNILSWTAAVAQEVGTVTNPEIVNALNIQAARFALRALELDRKGVFRNQTEALFLMARVKGLSPEKVGQALNFHTGNQVRSLAQAMLGLGSESPVRATDLARNLRRTADAEEGELLKPQEGALGFQVTDSPLWDLHADRLLEPLLPVLSVLHARFQALVNQINSTDLSQIASEEFEKVKDSLAVMIGTLEQVGIDPASKPHLALYQKRLDWKDWSQRDYPPAEPRANVFQAQMIELRASLDRLADAAQKYRVQDWAGVSSVLENETREGRVLAPAAQKLKGAVEAKLNEQGKEHFEHFAQQVTHFENQADTALRIPSEGDFEKPFEELDALLLDLEAKLRSELRFDIAKLSPAQKRELLGRVQETRRRLKTGLEDKRMRKALLDLEKAFKALLDQLDLSNESLTPLISQMEKTWNAMTEGPEKERMKFQVDAWRRAISDYPEILNERIRRDLNRLAQAFENAHPGGKANYSPRDAIQFLNAIEAVKKFPVVPWVIQRAFSMLSAIQTAPGASKIRADEAYFQTLRIKSESDSWSNQEKAQVLLLSNAIQAAIFNMNIENRHVPFLGDNAASDPEQIANLFHRYIIRQVLGSGETYLYNDHVGITFASNAFTNTPVQLGGPNLASHFAMTHLVGMEPIYRNGEDVAYLIARGELVSSEWVSPPMGIDSPPALKLKFKNNLKPLDSDYSSNEVYVFMRHTAAPTYGNRKQDYASFRQDFESSAPSEYETKNSASETNLGRIETKLIQLAREGRLLPQQIYTVTQESRSDFVRLAGFESISDRSLETITQQIQGRSKILAMSLDKKTKEIDERLKRLNQKFEKDQFFEKVIELLPNRSRTPEQLNELRKRIVFFEPVRNLIERSTALARVLFSEDERGKCVFEVEEAQQIALRLKGQDTVILSFLDEQRKSPEAALDFIFRTFKLPKKWQVKVSVSRQRIIAALGSGKTFGQIVNHSTPARVQPLVSSVLNKEFSVSGLNADTHFSAYGLVYKEVLAAQGNDPIWQRHSDLILAAVLPAFLKRLQDLETEVTRLIPELAKSEEMPDAFKTAFQSLQKARQMRLALNLSDETLTQIQALYQSPELEWSQWNLYPPASQMVQDVSALRERYQQEQRVFVKLQEVKTFIQAERLGEAKSALKDLENFGEPWQPVIQTLLEEVNRKIREASEKETKIQTLYVDLGRAGQNDRLASDTDLDDLASRGLALLPAGSASLESFQGDIKRFRSRRNLVRRIEAFRAEPVTLEADFDHETSSITRAIGVHQGSWPSDMSMAASEVNRIRDQKKIEQKAQVVGIVKSLIDGFVFSEMDEGALKAAETNVSAACEKARKHGGDTSSLLQSFQDQVKSRRKQIQKEAEAKTLKELEDEIKALSRSTGWPDDDRDLNALVPRIQTFSAAYPTQAAQFMNSINHLKSYRAVWRLVLEFERTTPVLDMDLEAFINPIVVAARDHHAKWPNGLVEQVSQRLEAAREKKQQIITKLKQEQRDGSRRLEAEQEVRKILTAFEAAILETEAEVATMTLAIEKALRDAQDLKVDISEFKKRYEESKRIKIAAIHNKEKTKLEAKAQWIIKINKLIPSVFEDILLKSDAGSVDKPAVARQLEQMITESEEWAKVGHEEMLGEHQAMQKITEFRRISEAYKQVRVQEERRELEYALGGGGFIGAGYKAGDGSARRSEPEVRRGNGRRWGNGSGRGEQEKKRKRNFKEATGEVRDEITRAIRDSDLRGVLAGVQKLVNMMAENQSQGGTAGRENEITFGVATEFLRRQNQDALELIRLELEEEASGPAGSSEPKTEEGGEDEVRSEMRKTMSRSEVRLAPSRIDSLRGFADSFFPGEFSTLDQVGDMLIPDKEKEISETRILFFDPQKVISRLHENKRPKQLPYQIIYLSSQRFSSAVVIYGNSKTPDLILGEGPLDYFQPADTASSPSLKYKRFSVLSRLANEVHFVHQGVSYMDGAHSLIAAEMGADKKQVIQEWTQVMTELEILGNYLVVSAGSSLDNQDMEEIRTTMTKSVSDGAAEMNPAVTVSKAHVKGSGTAASILSMARHPKVQKKYFQDRDIAKNGLRISVMGHGEVARSINKDLMENNASVGIHFQALSDHVTVLSSEHGLPHDLVRELNQKTKTGEPRRLVGMKELYQSQYPGIQENDYSKHSHLLYEDSDVLVLSSTPERFGIEQARALVAIPVEKRVLMVVEATPGMATPEAVGLLSENNVLFVPFSTANIGWSYLSAVIALPNQFRYTEEFLLESGITERTVANLWETAEAWDPDSEKSFPELVEEINEEIIRETNQLLELIHSKGDSSGNPRLDSVLKRIEKKTQEGNPRLAAIRLAVFEQIHAELCAGTLGVKDSKQAQTIKDKKIQAFLEDLQDLGDHDNTKLKRRIAAYTLGQMDLSDRSESQLREIIQALGRALNDSYYRVRTNAAKSLGKIKHPLCIPSLIQRLSDPNESNLKVQGWIEWALNQIIQTHSAQGILQELVRAEQDLATHERASKVIVDELLGRVEQKLAAEKAKGSLQGNDLLVFQGLSPMGKYRNPASWDHVFWDVVNRYRLRTDIQNPFLNLAKTAVKIATIQLYLSRHQEMVSLRPVAIMHYQQALAMMNIAGQEGGLLALSIQRFMGDIYLDLGNTDETRKAMMNIVLITRSRFLFQGAGLEATPDDSLFTYGMMERIQAIKILLVLKGYEEDVAFELAKEFNEYLESHHRIFGNIQQILHLPQAQALILKDYRSSPYRRRFVEQYDRYAADEAFFELLIMLSMGIYAQFPKIETAIINALEMEADHLRHFLITLKTAKHPAFHDAAGDAGFGEEAFLERGSRPGARSELRNENLYSGVLEQILNISDRSLTKAELEELIREVSKGKGVKGFGNRLRTILEQEFPILIRKSILRLTEGVYAEQLRFEESHPDFRSQFEESLNASLRTLSKQIDQTENANLSFAVPYSADSGVQAWILNLIKNINEKARLRPAGKIQAHVGIIADSKDLEAVHFVQTLKSFEVGEVVTVEVLAPGNYPAINRFLNLHENAFLLSDQNKLARQIVRKSQLVLSSELTLEASFPFFVHMVEKSLQVAHVDQKFLDALRRSFPGMLGVSPEGYSLILESARELIFQAEVSRHISTNA